MSMTSVTKDVVRKESPIRHFGGAFERKKQGDLNSGSSKVWGNQDVLDSQSNLLTTTLVS